MMWFFKHDWHLRLLCLVGALVVQYYVRKQEDVWHRTILLPVTVPVPTGLRVVEPPSGISVQVDLEGPGRILRALKDAEVRLDFDPSSVKPGKRMQVPVSVQLPESVSRSDRDRISIDWRPKSIPVQIVSDATKQFTVVVKPLNRLEGWEMREVPRATPPQVTVSGTQEAVGKVGSVVAEFPVDAADRINTLVTLQAVDAEGNPVKERLVLEPPQVLVAGLQQRVVLQKRVPVQPVFQTPPGDRVKVEVVPSRVRVTGPGSRVSDVYVVETDPIQLQPGQTLLSEDVALAEPREGVTVTPSRVHVTIRLLSPGTKPVIPKPVIPKPAVPPTDVRPPG